VKKILIGGLSWWAFLHVVWILTTFILWGVLNISDDNPLTAMSETVYDIYAFGLFRMRGWLILGFSPAIWIALRLLTGSARILPWRR
jgi:hypothetical protein